MELANIRGQATGPTKRLVQVLRQRPLLFYFLLAFGLTWACELIIGALHPPSSAIVLLAVAIGITLVGPTLAAFLMTAITQGRAGIRQLLRRYVLWRVGFSWYLLVLLGVPALLLIVVLPLPGTISAFRLPGLSLWLTYLIGYLLTLVAGPLGEEPGWRGFALPRLEQRSGPLLGTLLLGVLWGLWHLPLFFLRGSPQYALSVVGTSFAGHLLAFGVFVIGAIGLAVIITWVFNNTRGSLLLAILLHTSANAALGSMLPMLFPSLAGSPLFFPIWMVVLVMLALLIIAATRGRLSYQRYQRETALPAPVTDREQEKGEVRTSV